MTPKNSVEERVLKIGRDLLESARGQDLHEHWLNQFLIRLMNDKSFMVQALRFIDVLPALDDDRELARHLREYFGKGDFPLPRAAEWGIKHASGGTASHLVAPAVRAVVQNIARRFIGGASTDEAYQAVEHIRGAGMNSSLDLLGEAVVSEVEAEGYRDSYLKLIADMAPRVADWQARTRLDSACERASPRLNLSIKLSSLYSQLSALDPEGSVAAIKDRLRPVLKAAREARAFVFLDMEHFDAKDITLRVFREIMLEPALADWPDAGIALQAYLRDTEGDLTDLIGWVRQRGTPVTIRLVRGAYWDMETVIAGRERWDAPVWENKWQTDQCYERCLRLLLGNYPHVEAAVATHNVRSIALAMVLAEDYDLKPDQYEFQMLFGMADNLKQAVIATGHRLRVYVPYGELIPGMAYLVRRLLENSTSQSFLRLAFTEDLPGEELLAPPDAETSTDTSYAGQYPSRFANEPLHRFTSEAERKSLSDAIAKAHAECGGQYPLLIGGEGVVTDERIVSINPADPGEIIGEVAAAGIMQADAAIAAARAAFPSWRAASTEQRTNILRRAAADLRRRRDEFAAWEILEAGKPWSEADADVAEAIDYLEYYSREALRLEQGFRFDVHGEINTYLYQPRGVAVIISPWNFPLAILTGMLSAALVTGNTAIIKPSSQTPVIAAKLLELLLEAGLPPGTAHFLPGAGESVGNYLVRHPEVNLIAFTGSQKVGCDINRLAAELAPNQLHVKRVIAEMGGKNAIIIDNDADLDDAVTGVIASAFGYAGQKCSACSRVITVGGIHDRFLDRFVEAARSLRIGPPENPETFIGPVISAHARDRILRTIREGKKSARIALETEISGPRDGYYISPTIFTDVAADSLLAREEIFGPVLAILKAEDYQEAIQIANLSPYALTGGVFSRSPAHLTQARRGFFVGNLYLNRGITGAAVGRQPFGGFKLSGVGNKAGGPDYLKQFVEPRTVTENTLRRGFAPGPYNQNKEDE